MDTRKIDVAGLKIDAITKTELLKQITERIANKEKTFVVTPYSEFLYSSLRVSHLRQLLNKADYSVADGIGIFWAHLFLSQKLTFHNFYSKILQAWFQVMWTGAAVLLRPSLLYKDIPEKIVGADLVWDLVNLAEQNNFSIYILGGHGDTDKKTAAKFLEKHPKLNIVGTSNKNANDPSIFSDVTKANPDMLLVGLGPMVQEQWIADNLKDLPASFAIGLGGTFDYIAGTKLRPPKIVRAIGLEWLYRLITQPSRLGRIINATWGMVLALVRLKVFSSMPYRNNAVAVVINQERRILLCQRANGKNPYNHFGQKFVNYWQFPQGGLDDSEEIKAAAKRELFEETGISSVEEIGQANYRHEYNWNNAGSPLLNRKFRFKGQSQQTVFFKFTGDDDEIQLDQNELIDYQWVEIDKVETVIAPERREHARMVLAELSQIQV